MTQRRIERSHRSMKNMLLYDNYYCPDDLVTAIGEFVYYCDHRRYCESLDNVNPVDVHTGRAAAILAQRDKTKRETINRRRTEYRKAVAMRQTAD